MIHKKYQTLMILDISYVIFDSRFKRLRQKGCATFYINLIRGLFFLIDYAKPKKKVSVVVPETIEALEL